MKLVSRRPGHCYTTGKEPASPGQESVGPREPGCKRERGPAIMDLSASDQSFAGNPSNAKTVVKRPNELFSGARVVIVRVTIGVPKTIVLVHHVCFVGVAYSRRLGFRDGRSLVGCASRGDGGL